jgi:uncharacterized YigZ family protein
MEQAVKYRTISSPATAEFKDRGSKFLAYAYPVSTVQEIKEKIQNLKKEHPKAVHHCVAYRLGTDGTQYRASDDGEPSGSAGKPMLGQIDSAGFINVLVVVVRYFGGTLLGVPGLINAYKTATADALAQAGIIEKWIEDKYELEFDYPAMSEVLYLLKQAEATIYQQDLQLFCIVKTGIPRNRSADYVQRLSEIRGVTVKQVKEEI